MLWIEKLQENRMSEGFLLTYNDNKEIYPVFEGLLNVCVPG